MASLLPAGAASSTQLASVPTQSSQGSGIVGRIEFPNAAVCPAEPSSFTASTSSANHLAAAKAAYEIIFEHSPNPLKTIILPHEIEIHSLEKGDSISSSLHIMAEEAPIEVLSEGIGRGESSTLSPSAHHSEEGCRAAVAVADHQAALIKNNDLFKSWLKDKDLVSTKTSGENDNCLINTLIQHATGNYNLDSFGDTNEVRGWIEAKFPGNPSALLEDEPRALEAIAYINQKYGAHLLVCFIQANEDGSPLISTIVKEADGPEMQHPVVIWQQGGHYVAIAAQQFYTQLQVNSGVMKGVALTSTSSEIDYQSPPPINPRCVEHYQRAREYASQRGWTESSLEFSIPLEEIMEAFEKLMSSMNGKQFVIPMKARVVEIDKEGFKLEKLSKKQYKDPRIRVWIILALEALKSPKGIKIARFILNQLHWLDVEEYLFKEAEALESRAISAPHSNTHSSSSSSGQVGEFPVSGNQSLTESQSSFLEAERHYHALSLMHPFDAISYIKRAHMFFRCGHYDQGMKISRNAINKVTDPSEQEFLQYSIVMNIIVRNKPTQMKRSEVEKFLDVAFKMIERFSIEDTYFIKFLSGLLNEYVENFGVHDTPTLHRLFEYIKKILILTISEDPEISLVHLDWAEKMMLLIFSSYTTIIEDEGDSKNVRLRSMAKDYCQHPPIMKIFFNWCVKNECLGELIALYETHRPLNAIACLENYYLAKAITFTQASAPLSEIEQFLFRSHDTAHEPWTAFNMGSFLLGLKKPPEPNAATCYFEEAVKLEGDHPSLGHLLGLWACQWLCQNVDDANSTLGLLSGIDAEKARMCFELQARKVVSYEDVLHCAGFTSKFQTPSLPEPRRPTVLSISSKIKQWIEERKIPISGGYFGIPVHQRNTDRMPPGLEKVYREELAKKAARKETLTFPVVKHDCWIGKKGKNQVPRVDIEDYSNTGNSTHFQPLRFQRGATTYGGLRLPLGQILTLEMITEAYEVWLKTEKAYLVVFNPDHCTNLTDVYNEIFGMDVVNRRVNHS
ncbi:MAG: hypothetical protein ACHQUC_00645 [Chlamydiales bacterium]